MISATSPTEINHTTSCLNCWDTQQHKLRMQLYSEQLSIGRGQATLDVFTWLPCKVLDSATDYWVAVFPSRGNKSTDRWWRLVV